MQGRAGVTDIQSVADRMRVKYKRITIPRGAGGAMLKLGMPPVGPWLTNAAPGRTLNTKLISYDDELPDLHRYQRPAVGAVAAERRRQQRGEPANTRLSP